MEAGEGGEAIAIEGAAKSGGEGEPGSPPETGGEDVDSLATPRSVRRYEVGGRPER